MWNWPYHPKFVTLILARVFSIHPGSWPRSRTNTAPRPNTRTDTEIPGNVFITYLLQMHCI